MMPAPKRERTWRSTGPRTPAGKARAASNAQRRHGLTVPIRADPSWCAVVVELERALAGAGRPPHPAALMAAEAVTELARIARVREAMLGAADAAGALEALRKLDRYEGEAQAKKRKALWLMSCHRALGAGEEASLWR
jgi:hypothetical protein